MPLNSIIFKSGACFIIKLGGRLCKVSFISCRKKMKTGILTHQKEKF
jgi:hypothetical protein